MPAGDDPTPADVDHVVEVVNWRKFQHYSKRNPPWIKVHRDLLMKREYREGLRPATRAYLIDVWLLASQHNGFVPWDVETIAWKLRTSATQLAHHLDHMANHGFIIIHAGPNARAALARCTQSDGIETEAEQSKAFDADFDVWWAAYPRRPAGQGSKKRARHRYAVVRMSGVDADVLLGSVQRMAKFCADDPSFIPQPVNFLDPEKEAWAATWKGGRPSAGTRDPMMAP